MEKNQPNQELYREETEGRGAFYLQRGSERLAQMLYRRETAASIFLEHTEVDPSLKGQGIGRILLQDVARWARETGTIVVPECPYVRGQVEKDPSLLDVFQLPR